MFLLILFSFICEKVYKYVNYYLDDFYDNHQEFI